MPNKQDGDGYTLVMQEKDGAAILGAWTTLLQVASKCDPRGTLMRDCKIPHDAVSLSRITRIPEAVFQRALKILSAQDVMWLDVNVLDGAPHVPAPKCDPSTAPECLEGNGKNRIEQNGKNVWVACPEQLRLNALFKRRPTTKWSTDELSAWKSITPLDDEDFTAVERFHATPGTYHRKDLLTLLRHWGEEVDRARQSDHKPIPEPKQIQESITVKML